MDKNVGSKDARIRKRLGMISALLGILGLVDLVNLGTVVSVILLILAAVLVITGSTKKCSVYTALGVDTLEEDE